MRINPIYEHYQTINLSTLALNTNLSSFVKNDSNGIYNLMANLNMLEMYMGTNISHIINEYESIFTKKCNECSYISFFKIYSNYKCSFFFNNIE